jgi:hypothetical protein
MPRVLVAPETRNTLKNYLFMGIAGLETGSLGSAHTATDLAGRRPSLQLARSGSSLQADTVAQHQFGRLPSKMQARTPSCSGEVELLQLRDLIPGERFRCKQVQRFPQSTACHCQVKL